MGHLTRTLAAALLIELMSAGCALETRSAGPSSGGLDGDRVDFSALDGGVDDGSLAATPPDTTVVDTSAPDTNASVHPGSSTGVVAVEPACVPGTERASCPGTSCDPVTLTCTTMMLASRSTCETCFADSNCASMDHRCVWMTYRGEPFPDERMGFCLKLTEALAVDGGYACEPPFTVPLVSRQSPSGGKNQTYCGIQEKITTCFAVRAFHNGQLCPSGRDDECPAGGICRPIATTGNKTEFACTHGCTEDAECSSPVSKASCAGYCGG